LTHAAIPADEMEQAFAWRHLVAQDVWMVRLLGTGNAQQPPVRAVENTLKLWSGDRTRFTVPIPARQRNGIKVALSEPPDGVVIESCTPVPTGLAVVIRVQSDKAKPGLKGNLILEAYRETGQQQPQQPSRPRNRQRLALLPAIPFEVVAGPSTPGNF